MTAMIGTGETATPTASGSRSPRTVPISYSPTPGAVTGVSGGVPVVAAHQPPGEVGHGAGDDRQQVGQRPVEQHAGHDRVVRVFAEGRDVHRGVGDLRDAHAARCDRHNGEDPADAVQQQPERQGHLLPAHPAGPDAQDEQEAVEKVATDDAGQKGRAVFTQNRDGVRAHCHASVRPGRDRWLVEHPAHRVDAGLADPAEHGREPLAAGDGRHQHDGNDGQHDRRQPERPGVVAPGAAGIPTAAHATKAIPGPAKMRTSVDTLTASVARVNSSTDRPRTAG